MLVEKLHNNSKYSGAWNFSTNSSNYTVKKICKEFSKNINFKFIYSSSRHKEKILKLNSDKSRYLLKWKTQLSFQEMIRLTSEWYKEFLIGKNPAIYALIKLKILFIK